MAMSTNGYGRNRTLATGLAVAVLGVLALAGCSDGGGDDGGSSPTDFVQGTWLSACHDRRRQSIAFSGITFRIETIRYRDDDDSCTGRISRVHRNAISGRFVVGDGFVTGDGLEATAVDFIYDRGIEHRRSFSPSPYETVYLDGSTGIVYLGVKAAPNGGLRPSERPVAIDFGNGYTRVGD